MVSHAISAAKSIYLSAPRKLKRSREFKDLRDLSRVHVFLKRTSLTNHLSQ